MTTTNSISISGLKAATRDMEVISNNIANANTTGFKKSRTNFADVYANNLMSTQHNGLGVTVSSITQDFSNGTVDLTDRELDLYVNTNGFFQLENETSGQISYTRDGHFMVDKDGYVVTDSGLRVQGGLYANGVRTGANGDIQIPVSGDSAEATSSVDLEVNLDASSTVPATSPFDPTNPDTYNFTTTITGFDSLGVEHDISTYFVKTATANEWNVHMVIDSTTLSPASSTITFNTAGAINAPSTLNFSGFTPTGADPMTIALDLAESTQFGSSSEVNSASQDGFPNGTVTGLEVNDQGILSANYTNGQLVPIAEFIVAKFTAPEELNPISGNQWLETFDSGPPLVPSTNPPGTINAGMLENSNVDMTEELVDLLSAQRLYQANSQAISVTERTLDFVLNLLQ